MKSLTVIGSAGSIGTQTLDIVRENPDRFKVVAIAANKNVSQIEAQIREFMPAYVCMYDELAAQELRTKVADLSVKVVSGMDGLIECSTLKEVDVVVTAVVGMIGIRPTIAAIKAGKDIALANKETLVTAGHIIMPLVKEYGVSLLPVDSEHSAIFQSLQGINYGDSSVANGHKSINKIILTASGGPFRGMTLEQMKNKTKNDALKHPNWSMGAKITIDSATLVNKGLEMMEAGWLFGVDCDHIQVVVHPQSILHSAVEFTDGAVIGQMGCPDMKLPILYALTYPDRIPLSGDKLDFCKLSAMTFEEPDMVNFPALRLAREAMKTGGSLPTVFNAANEYLVAKFLRDEIGFLDIPKYIEIAMQKHALIINPSVDEIINVQSETEELLAVLLDR
ncbi:MAG: 1-deoxy-D-xylulose-5-phosphate reductoisomerase [Lachnospiraceae bacterium]|nr:1-deoxy-D-xylulose-5-phosphate reductoisomerase [Lachnospiraceae bacterium]